MRETVKEKRKKDKTMRGEEKHREERERLMEEIAPQYIYTISTCFRRVSSVTGPTLKRKKERIKQKKYFFK